MSGKDGAALDKLVVRYLGRGPLDDQLQRLQQLLAQVDAPAAQYEQWLLCGARVYQLLGQGTKSAAAAQLCAALIYVYLGQLERARTLLPASCLVERAFIRLWEAEAAAGPPRPLQATTATATATATAQNEAVDRLYTLAAEELVRAHRPVQATLAFHAAGRRAEEQQGWLQVLGDSRLLPYQQALVRVNLSLSLYGAGKPAWREAFRQAATAQQLLEEVADAAEARGERERALDCYRVLLQLGQALGRFENLAEGYLNCIRILKDEQLRLHALRYYEDFARVGAALGEHHTVAQLCREAADYLDQRGLDGGLRRHYQRRAAQAAMAAAVQVPTRGGAVTRSEQAYLLAIECWNALDDFVQVRECFSALAALPLPADRQQHYLRLVSSYPQDPATTVPTTPANESALPAFLRQQQAYPPVWQLDLVEWEAAGEPAAVALALLGDTQRATLTRRHALLVLLLSHQPSVAPSAAPPQRLGLIGALANLRAYEALPTLERLYHEASPRPGTLATAPDPTAAERAALLTALPKLLFKRTFYLILRGLDDPSAAVQKSALESLGRLHFPDAIAPLCRLFRDRPEPAIRSAVLHSLGRAHDLRAGEFLLDVLRHEPEPLRGEARRLLLRYENPELVPLVRRSLELDSGAARPALQAVLDQLTGATAPAAY